MGDRANSDHTAIDRKSEREFVATRIFDAPVRLVFEAWTKPELFKLWWVPKSLPMPLLSCEMDVRTGGGYRLTFGRDAASAMAFFGTYLDVTPPSRLVWTNDENGEGAVTTVTFEEQDGRTRVVLHELHPPGSTLDGSEDGLPEQFAQLDELLVTLAERAS